MGIKAEKTLTSKTCQVVVKHWGLENARKCVGLTVLRNEQKVTVSSLTRSGQKLAHDLAVSMKEPLKGSCKKDLVKRSPE